MKHRRFLAALTALTLGLSLSVPAFAEEAKPTPEEIQAITEAYDLDIPAPLLVPEAEADVGISVSANTVSDYEAFETQFIADYTTAHPEEYAAFDADAWFAENWESGCAVWTKEEYMTFFEVDDAGFKDAMWREYLSDQVYDAYSSYVVTSYEAAHPEEMANFDVNAYLVSQGYQDPTAAFMEDYGLDSPDQVPARAKFLYINDRLNVAETHAQAEAYRAADPESWESFDADTFFEESFYFYDGKDAYMGLYTLLTQEEFAEDMYVEYMTYYNYDSNWYPGQSSGDRPLTLVSNGEYVDAELTAADGVTYVSAETANTLFGAHFTEESVPLRAAAEANGWDVVWNANQNQVVLLNREAMMAGTDFSSFDELMNRLMKAQVGEAGQSYRTTGTSDISFTAFNSIDGDKTYHATVKSEALFRDNVYDVTVTVSVADLLGLLSQQTLDKLAADMPKFTLKDLKTLLTGVKVELIMNLNTGMVYWNAPILASFDDSVSADTWHALDLGLTADSLQKMMAGEWNTADILYDELVAQSESSWSPTYSYYSFTSSLDTLALLFGADRFTESGGTLTWKIDAKTVNGLMSELAGQDVSLFKEYDMAISVSENGKFSAKAAFRMDMDAAAAMIADSSWYATGAAETAAITWAMNLFDFRMASSSSGTADQASGTAEFHWKNQFSLKMDTQSSRKKTSDVPTAAPPEGAELVELGSF